MNCSDVKVNYIALAKLFGGKRNVYQKWIDGNREAIDEAYDVERKEDLTKDQRQTLATYRDCRARINELNEMQCAVIRTLYGRDVDFTKTISDEQARMEIDWFRVDLVEC